MKPGIALEDLKRRLEAADDRARYGLFFAACLREAAGTPADDFFVVGGSAIEVLTAGAYSSGDIDIVSTESDRVRSVLESWEFRREGRVWVNEGLRLVVDLVLPPYTGSVDRTVEVSTPYGLVRLAAVEDLVVKRLSSARHWKQPGDLEHARLLALQFGERLDWEYLERFAHEHRVADLAAALREEAASAATRRRRAPP